MWRPALGVLLGAALGSAPSCKVINEDHCANQEVPGNEFCREFSNATPYCSPCRRELHGCVDFEPFNCLGYSDELTEDEREAIGPDSNDSNDSNDEPMSTGEPGSTGAGSTSSGGSSSAAGSSSGGATTTSG